MANEITLSASLSASKGSTTVHLDFGPFNVTLTGTKALHNRQSIGTAEEALEMGEISAGGWCIMVNRDATNYVQVRPATGGVATIRMKAGEPALFRLDSGATAPYLIANTAACEVEYILLEN